MKTLFMILKATTGVTLIAPTILSVTQDLRGNYNKQDSSENSDHIVTASQDFMKNQLLDKEGQNEDLDGYFKNPQKNKIIPIGNFNNDNSDGDWYSSGLSGYWKYKKRTEDNNGGSHIRFGGGLFLDGTSYSAKSKKDLNAKGLSNDLVSSSNFVSTNPQKPTDVPASLPNLANNKRNNGDINPQISWSKLDKNKVEGHTEDQNTIDWTHYYQTQTSDFSKTKAQTDPNDKIVNENDLNYTPDYVPGTIKIDPTGSVTGKKSSAKNMFTQLFNIELKDWYWQTWGFTYAHTVANPTIIDKNIELANKRDADLKEAGILKEPKFNLSTSFNQLVSETESDPWYDKMIGSGGAAATGEAFGKIFDKLVKNTPLIGDIAEIILDTFLPDSYISYNTIQRLLTYQSVSLDDTVWCPIAI